MKYLKQITVILGISFISECMHAFIPLAVPANIYGIVILFLCLETGLIRAESVRETGKYLIRIMPVMFIPAAVGLMDAWPVLKPVLLPVAAIMCITTVVVMAVTGRVTQRLMGKKGRDDK